MSAIDREFLKQMDLFIRQGQGRFVLQKLSPLKPSEVPRKQRWKVAELFRRLQKPLATLKMLNSILKDHREGLKQASEDEIITFAGGLVKLGAIDEAIGLLDSIKLNHRAHFIKAAAHVAHWNYKKASPHFSAYIKEFPKETYAYQIGRLNLAATHVVNKKWDKAHPILNSILNYAKANNQSLLLGNALELLASLYVTSHKDYTLAKSFLDEAKKALENTGSVYGFYVEKWQTILELQSHGPTKTILMLLEKARNQAKMFSDFETIRDFDLHIAKSQKNTALIHHLIFGTYFTSYQKRIIEDYNLKNPLPKSFVWHADPHMENFETRTFLMEESAASPGSQCQKLFSILTLDFYRPLPMGFVFSKLYPGEVFNPYTSPIRLFRTVERLRLHLAKYESTLSVIWQNGSLQLILPPSLAIVVKKNRMLQSTHDHKISKLKTGFKGEWFTSDQASDLLKLSKRSLQRILKSQKESGDLKIEGRGRSQRYKFAKSS